MRVKKTHRLLQQPIGYRGHLNSYKNNTDTYGRDTDTYGDDTEAGPRKTPASGPDSGLLLLFPRCPVPFFGKLTSPDDTRIFRFRYLNRPRGACTGTRPAADTGRRRFIIGRSDLFSGPTFYH